jgi:hypothetical protein
MALGLTQSLTKMSTRNIPGGKGSQCVRVTTFKCWLSWNLRSSTSWNPMGLSRPVMGLLYLLATTMTFQMYQTCTTHALLCLI